MKAKLSKTGLSFVLMASFMSAGSLSAADIAAGAKKAAACAGCHGPEGISFSGENPNLKGQKAQYLLKQLKDFKSKARNNVIMQIQVASLSETDMANIAAYFESLGKKK